MDGAVSLGALAQALRAQGERAIRSRYPVPVLLVSPGSATPGRIHTPPSGNRRDDTTVPLDVTDGWHLPPRDTRRADDGPTPPGKTANTIEPGQLVVRLIKSDRNPFSGVITVGRAKSNDVVIASPEVSKVHAWIHPRGDGFVLSDNSSTNGTFVDSVRLAAKEERPLKPGLAIRFGPIACRLVTPDELVDYCAAVRG